MEFFKRLQTVFASFCGFFRSLLHHPGLRRYGNNLFWLFSEKAVRFLAGFSIGIYVARQLGPEQYGALSYAISLATIFGALSSLGLDSLVVRELVKKPEQRNQLLGSALFLRLLAFPLLFFSFCSFLFLTSSVTPLVLIICGGYFLQAFQVFELYYQSQLDGKSLALSQVIALILVSILRFTGAFLHLPLVFFAWCEVFYMAFTILCYMLFYSMGHKGLFNLRWNRSIVIFYCRNAWPLLLSGLAIIIYMRIDQIIVKLMLSDYDLGIYSVAERIVELFYFIPAAISTTLFPAIVHARQQSSRNFRYKLAAYFCCMFYLGLILTLAISAVGYLIILFYGARYAPSYPLLLVYVWRIFFLSCGMPASAYVVAKNLQVYSLYLSCLGAATNILLNLFLISRFGVAGTAWAAVITAAFLVFVFPCFLKKMRFLPFFYFKSLNPMLFLKYYRFFFRK